jgi:cardiolipin synthase
MRQLLNLPNLVTLSRVLAAPLAAALILSGAYGWALALLVAAGTTDSIDGWLARRSGGSTRFGAYLDPIADKILLVTVYLSLGAAGLVPAWLVMIVIGRDLLILLVAGLALLATGQRRFDPSVWGKLSTFIQIGAGVVILSARATGSSALLAFATVLPALVAVTTTWSGLHYVWRAASRRSD